MKRRWLVETVHNHWFFGIMGLEQRRYFRWRWVAWLYCVTPTFGHGEAPLFMFSWRSRIIGRVDLLKADRSVCSVGHSRQQSGLVP